MDIKILSGKNFRGAVKKNVYFTVRLTVSVGPVQQHNLPFKEYERAVIYRLGLMLPGGTQGPGESIFKKGC